MFSVNAIYPEFWVSSEIWLDKPLIVILRWKHCQIIIKSWCKRVYNVLPNCFWEVTLCSWLIEYGWWQKRNNNGLKFSSVIGYISSSVFRSNYSKNLPNAQHTLEMTPLWIVFKRGIINNNKLIIIKLTKQSNSQAFIVKAFFF